MSGICVSSPTAVACSGGQQANSEGQMSAPINSETICFRLLPNVCNALATDRNFFFSSL